MGEIGLHLHTAEIGRCFKNHAEESGATCTLLRIPIHSFLDDSAWLEMERLINDWVKRLTPPIALFAEEAPIARMVIQHCQEAGWDVPRDIAVLCQHNLKAVVDVAPQISSIEIDNERAGYEAAKLLDRLMAGQPAPQTPIFIPPKGVYGRESTDYFAIQDDLVAQALRYISARLQEPMRVEDVAYELAVSSRTLQSRFNDALGVGVSQEIRRLRLQRAKRLLTDPSYTIAEVGQMCGFPRPQLFSTVFHREIGITPRAYREQCEGESRIYKTLP